jgi:hypothetical protein
MAGLHDHTRKWRIRPALKRDGSRMARVYDLCMPGTGGVYERYMSIEQAMKEVALVERQLAQRPIPLPPFIPNRSAR